MRLIFADSAWDDYLYWQQHDKRLLERINRLIRETQHEPYSLLVRQAGTAQACLSFGSRRITKGHRMAYKVEGDALL